MSRFQLDSCLGRPAWHWFQPPVQSRTKWFHFANRSTPSLICLYLWSYHGRIQLHYNTQPSYPRVATWLNNCNHIVHQESLYKSFIKKTNRNIQPTLLGQARLHQLGIRYFQWWAKYFSKVFWKYKIKYFSKVFWKYFYKILFKSILKIQNKISFWKYFWK